MVSGMIYKIKTVYDIKWKYAESPLQEDDASLAKKLPFKLPDGFLELLKISDGGEVDYIFEYYSTSFKDTMISSIGELYGIATPNSYIPNKDYDPFAPDGSSNTQEFFVLYSNIIDNYYNSPEFFPKDLIAFAETPEDNMICFDYRNDPKTENPPIVYWDHGAYIGEDVSFLANNFEEFIQMLREPEPFEEFLKKISKKEE